MVEVDIDTDIDEGGIGDGGGVHKGRYGTTWGYSNWHIERVCKVSNGDGVDLCTGDGDGTVEGWMDGDDEEEDDTDGLDNNKHRHNGRFDRCVDMSGYVRLPVITGVGSGDWWVGDDVAPLDIST